MFCYHNQCIHYSAIVLWARVIKKTDCNTGPLARLFACSLSPLTRLLAPDMLASLAPSAALTHLHSLDCLLRSRPLLRSLIFSLTHSFCSIPRSWESKLLDGYIFCVFFSILDPSALAFAGFHRFMSAKLDL